MLINNIMIYSIMKKSAGFYSQLFKAMNHYLFCKQNNLNFNLDTTDWLFKYEYGWIDYFENININDKIETTNNIYVDHSNTFDNYPLYKYIDIIPQIYKYNEKTKEKIHEKMNEYSLYNKSYDSIFIRRGDKLLEESKFISVEKYIDLLLLKNPKCTDLFIQTDDYNCFIEIKEYIEKLKDVKINLYTLCPVTLNGVVVTKKSNDFLRNNNLPIHKNNYEYLIINKQKMLENKSLYEMTKNEIYQHTIDMIVGIDIVLHSNICITDFQSNVSRFIKLAHQKNTNVFCVNNPSNEVDLYNTTTPESNWD